MGSADETAKINPLAVAYKDRSRTLALAARFARDAGMRVWLGWDAKEEEGFRTVLYIELPTGQVSWHLSDEDVEMFFWVMPPYCDPAGDPPFDGHATPEKWRRVLAHACRP